MSETMKKVLANTFSMYLKVHKYHWNVEGPNFSEYHKFFGDLYEELHDAVDDIAERIRTLGVYAPGSYSEFFAYSDVKDETGVPLTKTMFENLIADNQTVIDSLNAAFKEETAAGNQGLVNYLAGRLEVHAKHGWMLKSFAKS